MSYHFFLSSQQDDHDSSLSNKSSPTTIVTQTYTSAPNLNSEIPPSKPSQYSKFSHSSPNQALTQCRILSPLHRCPAQPHPHPHRRTPSSPSTRPPLACPHCPSSPSTTSRTACTIIITITETNQYLSPQCSPLR